MASFRVHEDQENRVPELRVKQCTVAGIHQKRSVLSVIDNRINQKQPLQPTNCKVGNENSKKQNNKLNEAALNKQNTLKPPPPVVPVAQFEAFKVYEDEEPVDRALKQRKAKDDLSDVYKDTNQERFYTKREVLEMRKQKEEQTAEVPKRKQPTEDKISPMSIEKSETKKTDENAVTVAIKSNRDHFFEMEDYRADIYKYLREREVCNRPKPGYMKKQPDITHSMRTILVDWLVEVAEEYKLHTETLYLAVNFIDRFLSYMSVVRGKLQLVGTAAMFLAAKYEEIYPPHVSEFVYITDDTYNQRQVLRMEQLIIKILAFDLSIPTPLTFITATCITNKLSEKLMYLAMYLSELSMLEAEPYLEMLPSVIASSSIALARCILGEEPWDDELHRTTGYELRHLKKCVEFLHSMFVKAPTLQQQAIQEKYKLQKYLHVATIAPRDVDLKLDKTE